MAVDDLVFDPDTATLERWSDLEVLRLAIIDRASVCGQGIGDLGREPIRSTCCRAKAMRDIASVLVSLAPMFLDRWTPPLSNEKPLSALVLAKEYALAHPSEHATFDPEIISIYREFLRSAAWWLRRMRYVLLDDYCTCRIGTASYADEGPTDRDDIAITWRTSRTRLDRQAIFRKASWAQYYNVTSHDASSVSDVIVSNPASIPCNAFVAVREAIYGPLVFALRFSPNGSWVSLQYIYNYMEYTSDLHEVWTYIPVGTGEGTCSDSLSVDFGSGYVSIATSIGSCKLTQDSSWTVGTATISAIKCLVTESGPTYADDTDLSGEYEIKELSGFKSFDRKMFVKKGTIDNPAAVKVDAYGTATLIPDGFPFPSVEISSKSDYLDVDVSYSGTLRVIGDYGPFYPHLPTET